MLLFTNMYFCCFYAFDETHTCIKFYRPEGCHWLVSGPHHNVLLGACQGLFIVVFRKLKHKQQNQYFQSLLCFVEVKFEGLIAFGNPVMLAESGKEEDEEFQKWLFFI